MAQSVNLGTLDISDSAAEAVGQWGVQNADVVSGLQSNIDAATTTIPTTGAGSIAVNDLIAIDKEIMLVGAKAAGNLTVTRAQILSTAATHAAGAEIKKLKKDSLRNLMRQALKVAIGSMMSGQTTAAIAAQEAIIAAAQAQIAAIKEAVSA